MPSRGLEGSRCWGILDIDRREPPKAAAKTSVLGGKFPDNLCCAVISLSRP